MNGSMQNTGNSWGALAMVIACAAPCAWVGNHFTNTNEHTARVTLANSFGGVNNPYQGWITFELACGEVLGRLSTSGEIIAEVSLNNTPKSFQDSVRFQSSWGKSISENNSTPNLNGLSQQDIEKIDLPKQEYWLGPLVSASLDKLCSSDHAVNFAEFGKLSQTVMDRQSHNFADYLEDWRVKNMPKEPHPPELEAGQGSPPLVRLSQE